MTASRVAIRGLVYVDADIIIRNTWLPELVFVSRQAGYQCRTTDIVFQECLRKKREVYREAEANLKTAANKFERVTNSFQWVMFSPPSIDEVMTSYASRLRRLFDLAVTDPRDAHLALLHAAARLPFNTDGTGERDVALFLTATRSLRLHSEVHLISTDNRFHASDRSPDGILNEPCGRQIRLYRSVEDFLLPRTLPLSGSLQRAELLQIPSIGQEIIASLRQEAVHHALSEWFEGWFEGRAALDDVDGLRPPTEIDLQDLKVTRTFGVGKEVFITASANWVASYDNKPWWSHVRGPRARARLIVPTDLWLHRNGSGSPVLDHFEIQERAIRALPWPV